MSERPFDLQSRDEEILAATIDGTEYTDKPQSRIEYLLLELKEVIEGGGSSSDYAAALSLTIDTLTYVMTAQLLNKDGDPVGQSQSIDLPLESTVVSGSYSALTKSLVLTLVSGQTISIPLGDLVSGLLPDNYNYTEFGNGKRLYVSDTEPTGTIPEGSLGVGW
jgi:hypothetical protein